MTATLCDVCFWAQAHGVHIRKNKCSESEFNGGSHSLNWAVRPHELQLLLRTIRAVSNCAAAFSCDCAGVLQLNLCILQQKAMAFHEWVCFLFYEVVLKKTPTRTWIMTLKYRFLILVWVSGCWWNDYHWNKKPRYRHSQWMQDFKTLLTQANCLFAILASGDANTGWRQRQRSRGRVAPGRGP